MKKLFVTILVLLVPAVIAYQYYSAKRNATPPVQVVEPPTRSANPAPSTIPENLVKTYTMDEVAMYVAGEENNACWTVIHDKVYDITEYVNHPGGEQIYEICGKDGTILFEKRPDIGTSHPQSARDILEKYYIGDLKK